MTPVPDPRPRTFDVAAWDSHYRDETPRGESFLFRRSHEVALECALRAARPGELWLDVGCGTGRLAEALGLAGLRVLALDVDPAMLRTGDERMRRRSALPLPRPLSVTSLGQALPLADGVADGVVAASLLGCIPSAGALHWEFHRVLRPGGHAVLTFTNRASRLLRLNYRLPRRFRSRVPRGESSAPFELYVSHEAEDDLRRVGFEILATRFYNHVLQLGGGIIPPRRLALALDRLAARASGSAWARNFAIVARKPVGG